jgi:hypothetical protein
VYCVLQTFAETDNPAILFNGNNEYLHYQDTWYILGYKPDAYVVSRQCHSNALHVQGWIVAGCYFQRCMKLSTPDTLFKVAQLRI